jgi:signal transduction histidine kinase
MLTPVSTESAAEGTTEASQLPREALVAASIPGATLFAFFMTLLYSLAGVARFGSWTQAFPPPTIVQMGVPLVAWALVRGPCRRRSELLALGADLGFTAAMIARLFTPFSTVSGIALFLSLKMLATALFFPWRPRMQYASAIASLLLYYGILWLSGSALDAAGGSLHQLFGPLIGAALSAAGAARADVARGTLYQREVDLAQEARVSEALARVGQAMISSLDRPAVVERLCQVTTEVLDCDCSHTVLWDPAQKAFVPVASYGYTPEVWEVLRVVKVSRESLGESFVSMQREGVGQIRARDLPPAWRRLAEQLGLQVSLAVTLMRGDEIVGLHSASRRTRGDLFTGAELRIARGIARIAALALENLRLVEELEQSSRVKSEFVATISHELRSPLNVIMGYSELLLGGAFGPLASEQRESLERLERSGHELHELITATLDLSRIEAGTVDLDIADVAVDELVDRLDEEIRELRDKDGLRFCWQVGMGLPVLRTDPLKLKVVLKNLIANAIKFTEQGSVSVEIDPSDGGVEFRVVDTGIGIAPEGLSRIFEAFRQEQVAGGRGRGGVGLGLYIVRRLVDLLGGRISVESEVGQGSTFQVWIPRLHPETTARAPNVNAARHEGREEGERVPDIFGGR